MIRHMFFGLSDQPELGRVLGAVGGANYVFWPPVFEMIALWKGQPWDPVAFCAAYGGGFAALAAGIGALIRLKDTGVSKAKARMADQ